MGDGTPHDDAPRVVVLDDDPTGSQSAADVTVLLECDAPALVDVLSHSRSVYVQTNSRSLSERDAVAFVQSIRRAVEAAREDLGVDVRVVLRGDSTLRGHIFAESRVFLDDDAVLLFVPAFPGGGRVTRGGVHLLRSGEDWVPVGDSEFARDPVFGFRVSSLAEFVEEKSGDRPILVLLEEVRAGRLLETLREAPSGAIVVADAVDDHDIVIIADAVAAAWRQREVIVRAAAPLAAELAGVVNAERLDPTRLRTEDEILVVCGSHTELARAQVAHLAAVVGAPTEIDTDRALADPEAEALRAVDQERNLARPGRVRFLTTERDRSSAHGSLVHGAAVMAALTTAAGLLARRSGVVITKGGITAADVLKQSLGVRRARVLGQIAPGVSVWASSMSDGRLIRCVIVPGNMGTEDILTQAVRWARTSPTA